MKKSLLKKCIALGMTLGMLTGTLAACGSPASETKAAQTDMATAGNEDNGNGGEVTLRLVHYMGEQAKRDALDRIITKFNEQNPNIRIDIEIVNSAQYIATYKNYIAAGDAPDIMFGKPQNMTEFVEGGYFMDLKGEDCMKNVLPLLVKECTLNGGVYGFPIDAQAKGCFYNKKMFEKANVSVPTTREEFFQVCDSFMDKGTYPLIQPYNFIHGVFHELDAYFTSMAITRGMQSVWMDSQGGVAMLSDNPDVKEAFEIFTKISRYKDPGDTAVDQAQGIQNFAAEQRPMYINGGWLIGDTMAANPDGSFGMFPVPWSDNAGENKLWIGIDDCFVVSENTEHKDEVMTFLAYLAGNEASEIWMDTAKLMSSNVNVSTDDATPLIQDIKTYIDEDKIAAKADVPDYTSEYSTAFRTILQEYVALEADQQDVAILLKDIDDEIASINAQK